MVAVLAVNCELVELLHCTLETTVTLGVNYTSIKKKKIPDLEKGGERVS